MTRSWIILTGEYPPMPGGVSDHARLLAHALAAAGDEVQVFVPRECQADSPSGSPLVRRLPDHFGPAGLACLSRWIDALPVPARLLVEYTPQAFGCRGMNIAFCLWLRAAARGRAVDVLFHEVHYPIEASQPLRHNVLGTVTRWMARTIARSADRVFVSTEAWEPIVRRMVRPGVPICVMPVPSNLPTEVSARCVATARQRATRGQDQAAVVGHFGTYGPWTRNTLADVFVQLLRRHDVRVMFIGRGSEAFVTELARRHPHLAECLIATGELSPEAAAAHVAACDLLVQPYPDGITCRRSSAIAGLALGVPVVTNHGNLTESTFWAATGAVALAPSPAASAILAEVESLLGNPDRRARLSVNARQTYARNFHIDRTIEALRNAERATIRATTRSSPVQQAAP